MHFISNFCCSILSPFPVAAQPLGHAPLARVLGRVVPTGRAACQLEAGGPGAAAVVRGVHAIAGEDAVGAAGHLAV